ncbi:hypothetical protein COU60_01925 [Candidatus Pacearchaeota archaeon CG10_big_fil_rev_8_21_14_0_10_34_76]|nr:MAG: hypothetical protein COU60_01925 [Candidatus Pacearchaeota archaeon CG10_big_fil_rev_8_21_14_0_10_34_76]
MSYTLDNSKRILASLALAGAVVFGGAKGLEYFTGHEREVSEIIENPRESLNKPLPESLQMIDSIQGSDYKDNIGNNIKNEHVKEVPQVRETIGRTNLEDRLIVIDAGHGMGNAKPGVYDPGAVFGDLHEADINLDVSERVKDDLAEKGYIVNNLRESLNVELPLSARAKNANELGAEVFVSVHVNSYEGESESAKGVRTYYFPGSVEGKELGKYVQDNLIEILEDNVEGFSQNYEGLREGNFKVLRETDMPAILVEMGFITNERDRRYMVENSDVIAEGIAEGIDNYLNERKVKKD